MGNQLQTNGAFGSQPELAMCDVAMPHLWRQKTAAKPVASFSAVNQCKKTVACQILFAIQTAMSARVAASMCPGVAENQTCPK